MNGPMDDWSTSPVTLARGTGAKRSYSLSFTAPAVSRLHMATPDGRKGRVGRIAAESAEESGTATETSISMAKVSILLARPNEPTMPKMPASSPCRDEVEAAKKNVVTSVSDGTKMTKASLGAVLLSTLRCYRQVSGSA